MTATRFIWVGNHPGLDLANTRPVVSGAAVELLASFDDVLDWCEQSGVLRDHLRPHLEQLSTRTRGGVTAWVRRLREALRTALDPTGAAEHGIHQIDRLLAPVNGHLALPSHPTTTLDVVSARPADQLRLDLARAALTALTDLDRRRVRRCSGAECVLLFYDTSRGGRRCWCDMAICGNRAKVAAFEQRRRRGTGRSR